MKLLAGFAPLAQRCPITETHKMQVEQMDLTCGNSTIYLELEECKH